MQPFEGVLTCLVTPFHPGGGTDLDSLASLVKRLSEARVSGIILFDRLAETDHLSENEMLEIQRAAVRAAGKKTPVIVAMREADSKKAAWRAQWAAGEGADSLLVGVPHTLPPESQLNLELFRAVRKAVSIPVILDYDSPSPDSPADPSSDGLLTAYVEIDSVRVEAVPAGPVISALRERSSGHIAILSGLDGRLMLDSLDRGAVGVTPGCSTPEIFSSILKYHGANARDEAERLWVEFLPLLCLMTQSPALHAACEKILLAKRGWIASDATRQASPGPDAKHRADLFRHLESLARHLGSA